MIFPTETVYGIGCDPGNAQAVAALFAAKQRPWDKPLAIHLAAPAQAARDAARIGPAAQRIIERFWPGPVAVIVDRRPAVAQPAALGGATISLRCPSDRACAAILRATGPLAATSANISGRAPFCGAEHEIGALPPASLALITGRILAGKESTVLDCSGGSVKLVREGALPAAAVWAALDHSVELSRGT